MPGYLLDSLAFDAFGLSDFVEDFFFLSPEDDEEGLSAFFALL